MNEMRGNLFKMKQENNNNSKENSYNSDSIVVLSDIAHIRRRAGMYIGDAENPGQLFSEAFDNSADEVQSGYSDHVEICVDTKENKYSVRDYGRGIPHGTKKLEDGSEKEVIEVLCTKAFSGGKFDENSYKISSGLNGLGLCCINALSDYMKIESIRDGESVSIRTSKGKSIGIDKHPSDDPRGTLIEFIPDPEFFPDSSIPQDFILNRCHIASAFGMKSKLTVDGKPVSTDADIYSLVHEDEDISVYDRFSDEVIDGETGERVIFAIEYTSDTTCKYKGYTNLLPNTQGGTHFKMMDSVIESTWKEFNIPDVITKDYYLGLRVVVAVFISETSFSSQTKERLTVDKSHLEKFIPMIRNKMIKWLNDNPDTRDGLIKRFKEYRESQNKLLSKKEIRNLVIVNNDVSGSVRRKSVVRKLNECSSRSREDTELYIVEGDSACSSLIQARDVRTQALLPIRGKILNVSRFEDVVKCLKNEEVCSIVNAAGTGILSECNNEKSRYERYIICSDADVDGLQIASLVMSVFINLLPDVVMSGMLYLSNPPLYGWQDSKGIFHFTNEQKEIPQGINYSRYKGLGEMDPPELKYSIMDKDHRMFTRVKYPEDVDRFNNILTSASLKYDILYELGLISYIE
jgi:DNA gyrase/topoisomerase IV subunit B